jgi:galactose mutarotase-like enzyme
MTDGPDLTTIASQHLAADIDAMGAQLWALRDAQGRDLQWNGDAAFWTGRAPILFPIVGMLEGGRYRLDGETLPMPKHGFARRKRFAVVKSDGVSALFRLSADAETLAVYPFDFRLDLNFTLEGATLDIKATVHNAGDRPMPASFGFHPALRWPLPYGRPRAEHRLQFEHDEPAPIRRITSEGVLRPESFPTPVQGRELILRDDLFADDAVIFDQLRSSTLLYGAAEGPQLKVSFPHTPYLGVWTRPGAPYICIEPWRGIADPAGYAGDFRQKPGVFEVAPGGAVEIAMSIALVG